MMKEGFAIRPAEFKDAEPIFRLIKKHPQELLARSISDIVQNVDRFLVCVHGDRVIGTVSWQILPEIGDPKDPTVEIKSLAVDPHHQKTGLGRALVSKAIEYIQELRPVQILVLTFTPKFFKKLGFRKVSKKRMMHKIYAGCINCSKYDSPFTCPETAMTLVLREHTE